MSNNAPDQTAQQQHFADIFARLHEQDIEQFYAHYQLWVLRRRVPTIERQLAALREHLTEHRQHLKNLRPSALALAVLARLQSNGVSNIDVLDLMLDRGEDWLDRMMQRLDYCEQVEDFIQGDYTQWCVKSLEGAYDWMDSLLGSLPEEGQEQEPAGDENTATEELLLQKLSLDEDEELLTVALAQPIVQLVVTDELIDLQELNSPADTPLSEQQEDDDITSQPASISPPADTSELQAGSDAEPQPAPLSSHESETSDEPPAPWYSVDVTASGASSTPTETEQTSKRDDWIKVLQAENVARIEAGETEVITYSAEELLTSDDQETEALTAQLDRTEAGVSTQAAAPTDILPTGAEVAEPELSVETASEPESISPTQAETTLAESSTLSPEDRSEENVSFSAQSATLESRDEQDEIDAVRMASPYALAQDEINQPESNEPPKVEENTIGQVSTPHLAESVSKEASEIAGQPGENLDEETQPFALKEIQDARQGQISEEQEASADESGETQAETTPDNISSEVTEAAVSTEEQTSPGSEVIEPTTSSDSEANSMSEVIEPTTGSDSEANSLNEVIEATTSSDVAANSMDEVIEATANSAVTVEAAETIIGQEYAQTAGNTASRAETATNKASVHAQLAKSSGTRPVASTKKPRKKSGFWRRLFGFGKKRGR